MKHDTVSLSGKERNRIIADTQVEPKGKETPKKTQENVSAPKRMLNMVCMKAELKKKKEVVKERDEHRKPTTKQRNRNVGSE